MRVLDVCKQFDFDRRHRRRRRRRRHAAAIGIAQSRQRSTSACVQVCSGCRACWNSVAHVLFCVPASALPSALRAPHSWPESASDRAWVLGPTQQKAELSTGLFVCRHRRLPLRLPLLASASDRGSGRARLPLVLGSNFHLRSIGHPTTGGALTVSASHRRRHIRSRPIIGSVPTCLTVSRDSAAGGLRTRGAKAPFAIGASFTVS